MAAMTSLEPSADRRLPGLGSVAAGEHKALEILIVEHGLCVGVELLVRDANMGHRLAGG